MLNKRNYFTPFDNMISVDGFTDLTTPEGFVVNGSKCRVRLSTTHLVVENQPSPCYIFGSKKPLEIPLQNLISIKTTSTAGKKNKLFVLDANVRLRCWLLQARQTVYDRSIKYENQNGEDGNGFWTPHSKEIFGWQTNNARGDTLIVNYVTTNPNDAKWSMNSIKLKHTSEDAVAHWSHLLGCALEKSAVNRPKNLLVFINPFGGKGQALNIFNTTVVPLFRLAGIKYKVVVTERANHARDMLRTDPLDGIDGVVCVGGDGMFSELFNGLLIRSMEEENRESHEHGEQEVHAPKVRVGLIPGGSTNAVVLSLHGTTDVVTATLHILLGDRRNIDVSSVRSEDNKFYRFFMAMISYGYFGDLMVHSERLRWLGPKRYDVSGVHTFLGNKAYKGVIQYVEETNPDLRTDPKRINDACYVNCVNCERAGKDGSESESRVVSKIIQGEFKVVTGAVMICACHHTPRGLTPSAHLGDGQMDLILVRKTSRLNYWRYLYRTGYMNKSPFDLPFVDIHRVKEFTFTPTLEQDTANNSDDDNASSINVIERKSSDDDDVRKSVWNCDGEILPDPKIRVKVHCQILPVFARGLEKPATP